MQFFSLSRLSSLGRRLMMIILVGVLSLTGTLTVVVQPGWAQVPFNSKEAHGQTKQELTGRAKGEPLSAEERLDRAYDISESAGMREEKRQAEGKFDPREGNESVVEKAADAVQRVTGTGKPSK